MPTPNSSPPRGSAPQAGRAGRGRRRAHRGGPERSAARSPFQAIEPSRARLADEVYRQVLDAVLAGDLAPGERIVQDRIAQEINVSRTPVREALLHLEREGILAWAGTAGFTVRGIDESEVRDIYQAREAIEGYAARVVAEQRSAASLKRIEQTVEKEESIATGGVEEYFHANRRIHRSIVEETGNRYLLKSFDAIWNRGFSFRVFASIEHSDLDASLHEHAGLVASMRSDHPRETGEAMIAHIRQGLTLQLRALAEQAAGRTGSGDPLRPTTR